MNVSVDNVLRFSDIVYSREGFSTFFVKKLLKGVIQIDYVLCLSSLFYHLGPSKCSFTYSLSSLL